MSEAKNKSSTSNTNKNKTSYISVPQRLIYDKSKGMCTKAKYLYIILKKHSANNIVKIKYSNLMESLKWTDNRTLKRYLIVLNNFGYIEYKIDSTRIYSDNVLELKIVNIKPFILLAREVVEKGLKYDKESYSREKGIIYLYLMEDKYNEEWGYACPNRKEISDIIGLNNGSVTDIIKYYHDKFLCEHYRGWKNEETGDMIRSRYLVNNISKDGNSRYKKHKRKEYFT